MHPLRVDEVELRTRQRTVTERRWTMLDQVHGLGVHRSVRAPASPGVAGVGDILVTSEPDVPIAIWAADCAPVVLFGGLGTTVNLHAGWRGLAAGVVDAGVDILHASGEDVVLAVLGPTIHPCCYEFGESDLNLVAAGTRVDREMLTGATTEGGRSLDVPTAVSEVLRRRDIELEMPVGCTGCDDRWFSHRVRVDTARHAVVAWNEL